MILYSIAEIISSMTVFLRTAAAAGSMYQELRAVLLLANGFANEYPICKLGCCADKNILMVAECK